MTNLRPPGNPTHICQRIIGLPDTVLACLFDMDGVLTETATVHAAAWKEVFDQELSKWATESGRPFVPFDSILDYDRFVDGKPRAEGVTSFLASRSIRLPYGTPDDPPGAATVFGLGNHKQAILLRMIRNQGVQPHDGSVRYVRAARAAGMRTAVVSSSTNCREILHAAGIAGLFDHWIDGIVADRQRLRGKPAPDTFLAAAELLGVQPSQAAVFEDALAGVEAARAGGFGFVVAVDRAGQGDALRARGADIVVSDLAELLDDP